MSFVSIGDVLAQKYRVDRILGIGGMGMVVAATHLELDQRVALKFMLPDALLSPTAADRFLREARAAVKLRGEHVCRVLDVGKLDNGAPYIVMEYLEGEDFAHVIARHGVLAVQPAVDYVLQALEGLAEAHVNGIVHRDLKPGNLYVATDNDGSPLVKVLDFGISKSGGNATKTGDVMGSPGYMAPEQMISAKDVDARADLWAIGVILYQATSGRLPFEGDNIANLCMAVLNNEPPSLEVVAPHVPSAFAAVVMRCMNKQREGRHADASELAAALAPFGSPDAAASSARISKVLRRVGGAAGSSVGIAVTQAASASDLPAIRPPTPIPHGTPTVAGVPTAPGVAATSTPAPASISTIGASAGESLRSLPSPPARRRWPLLVAIGSIAVVAIVIVVATTTGGSGSRDPEPAKPPQVEPVAKDPPKDLLKDPPKKEPPNDPPPQKDPPNDPPHDPEPRKSDPVVVQKKAIKPKIEVKAGSGSARPTGSGSGSGSSAIVVGTGSGSVVAPTNSGSGYKGTKGKILTEYPPSK